MIRAFPCAAGSGGDKPFFNASLLADLRPLALLSTVSASQLELVLYPLPPFPVDNEDPFTPTFDHLLWKHKQLASPFYNINNSDT
jgi:hypothetical protein